MSIKQYKTFLWCMLTLICSTFLWLFWANENKTISVDYSLINSTKPICEIATDTDYVDQDVHMVVPSGEPIGIYVKTKGVMVINTGEIETKNGEKKSPCNNELIPGDYIVSVNGNDIEDKNDLITYVDKCNDEPLNLGIIRDSNNMEVLVKPMLNMENKYMLGLWVKDDISGIGTMTYYDENGFGALGHSINDTDTGKLFWISDGAIYKANLINIVKADSSNPGRLEGLIDYSASNVIGRVADNSAYGIKGNITKVGKKELNMSEWMPIAKKEEAHLGEAYVISSVSGKRCYYDVEITNIDISSNRGNKGIELVVKDEELLGLTSGIVQGMSGTPIVQDGKLIGAVTHVFLKDSTKGYGTFVEDMIK